MQTMIETERYPLQLITPFTISYGSTSVRENVLLRVTRGEQTAVGEAAVVYYYHETAERVEHYLHDPAVQEVLASDPRYLEDAFDALPPAESSAAHTAVDLALHDLWGQALGQPLYRLWGLNPDRAPHTSLTIAIDEDEAAYREHIREAAKRFRLLKLKLGGPGGWEADLRRVQIARAETDAALCVDANNGWDVASAQAIIPRLMELGMVFIEQPLPRHDLDAWRALRPTLPADHPPIIADETVQGVADVLALVGLVDGINIKLAKCGGLHAARQMIAVARAYGMQVMIGCMVESSVAITAAAHLAPLVDYADLDANVLISNDPYEGVTLEGDRLVLPDRPGLGVRRRATT